MESAQDKYDRARIGRPRAQGWFARMFDPVFIALIVLSCVTAAVGVYRAAGDAAGDAFFTMPLFVGGAALPTVWAVLRGLWHRDPEVPTINAALVRTVVAPLVSVWPAVLTGLVTVLLPPVSRLIVDSRSAVGWHYNFSVDDGSPAFVVAVLGGLLCVIAAMLAGLVLSVVVVLPFVAFRRPVEAVETNMMDSSPAALPANTRAIRWLAILIILIFVVPTFIVVGKDNAMARGFGDALGNSVRVFSEPGLFWGDCMWVVGVFLIPVGVVLTVLVKLFQRPDHDARNAAGVSAWGDRHKRTGEK